MWVVVYFWYYNYWFFFYKIYGLNFLGSLILILYIKILENFKIRILKKKKLNKIYDYDEVC